MRRMGLAGAVRGKPVRTTVRDEDGVRATDLVRRQFAAGAPNRLWVADFTYVSTWAATVYVAFAIDVFSRKIVGWRASTSKETDLVLDAIDRGLRDRSYRPGSGIDKLVHHSDAGSQYTSFRFTQHLVNAGIDASIGTVGDALDNALAESTIGLYKTELIKRCGPWHNLDEVDVATAAWVDWYNNRRLHGACGGRPPTEFEARRAGRPNQSGRLRLNQRASTEPGAVQICPRPPGPRHQHPNQRTRGSLASCSTSWPGNLRCGSPYGCCCFSAP
jgi:putative transposase